MQKSLGLVTLIGLRAAGPLSYYPAHINAAGKKVNARSEGSFYLNDFYIDAGGNRIDTSDVIRLVFWAGNQAVAGKGLADTAAKFIAAGKEIHCLASINTYQGKVYDSSDNVVTYGDGTPLMTKRVSFVVEPRSLRLGDDSEKLLTAEYAMFGQNGGALAFDARPIDWRTQGSVGSTQWGNISAWRSSQVFVPGQPTYGYAKVGVVAGTPVSSHNTAAPAIAGTDAATAAAVAGPVVLPAAPTPTPAAVEAEAGQVASL